MEDSFRLRVDKVFGSLASSSTLSNLWSLTGEEIEKRERKRERDTDDASPDCQLYPSGIDDDLVKQLRSDLQELDDDEEEEEPDHYNDGYNDNKKKKKPNPHVAANHKVFDIRSSIGLDCTLDYEEEEDEFDKVAVDREEAGDILYDRDIVAHGTDHENSHDKLPSSFKNVNRDPRADHMAAKRKLNEDAESAGNFVSLKISVAALRPAMDAQDDEQLDNTLIEGTTTSQEKSAYNSVLPDYVRNPARYKFDTPDSSNDSVGACNPKACTRFLNLLRKQNSSVSSSKLVKFVPRKKARKDNDEFKQKQAEFWKRKAFPLGIATGNAEDCSTEECPMEEDKPDFVVGKRCCSSQKPGRRYRTRRNVN